MNRTPITDACPTCGHVRYAGTRLTSLRRTLDRLGTDWTPVRYGTTRHYMHKLAARYPAYEWRHERVSLLAGNVGSWTI